LSIEVAKSNIELSRTDYNLRRPHSPAAMSQKRTDPKDRNGTTAVGRDDPVRVRVSPELREGEQSLRLQIEGLRDFAIFMLDRDGCVATWNAGAERFKGYRAAEIIGKHFSCFYPAEDIAARKPQRELSIAERDGRFEDEAWRVRKDGSKFWANVLITALRDPNKQLIGFGKVTRDISERLKATEQFRLAIEAAPTGMLMMDRMGHIVLVNVQVERLFGYPREELLGQRIEMLVPERFRGRHPEFRQAFFGDPKARAMGGGRELYGLRKDGSEVPIEIGLNPLHTPEGDFVLSSVVDITERKGADRERENLLGQLRTLNAELEERVRDRTAKLSATLTEREVLLQEVHHRVKNNLQVISSLINMQVRQLQDTPSRDALQECQTRVQAIALIHEKLYQSKDYARVPFSEYAKSLAANVFDATGASATDIVLDLAMEDLSLAVDKAIPCGLILNELITNAVKHAFPDARRGTIRVELRKAKDRGIVLAVGDDGIGMSATLDLRNSSSLGLSLVYTLVEQLEGRVETFHDRGTTFQVSFPMGAEM
jgi:PAS domain S-box-containing protein